MKLTHHDDGTFSLTGLSMEDAHDLAVALGAQAAHEARLSEGKGAWPGFDQSSADFFARRWKATEAWRSWLDKATRWGTGLKRRTSSTFDRDADAAVAS
jgi:hypothetical protein